MARRVLLPEGYPASVSGDYLEYQLWDTLQAFASSVTGSLATAAVLRGVGVGDASATPLAATLAWILKDGAGMVGRIVFAAYTGSSLDHDCKRWRLFADVTNDCVLLVELAAPALPRPMVLPVLCLAGVGRSLVGVAGGATKAAVAQHQARGSNMADLCAKDGSQETVVNLVALCLNLAILPLVSESQAVTFSLFLVLTLLHIYANYRAVSCLVMPTLNSARLEAVLEHLGRTGEVLGPAEGNRREVVVGRSGLGLRLGISLAEVGPGEGAELAAGPPWLVLPGGRVLLSQGAGPGAIYTAAVEALVPDRDPAEVVAGLEAAGWSLDTLALPTEGYRYCAAV
jgi:hypothetical protein